MLVYQLRPQLQPGVGSGQVRGVSELTANQPTKMGISPPEELFTKMSGGVGKPKYLNFNMNRM